LIDHEEFSMTLGYSARNGSCFEEKDDVAKQRYIGEEAL